VGRLNLAPSSASVASGCWSSKACRRACRAGVSKVWRPH
jgi:hypothetical protein